MNDKNNNKSGNKIPSVKLIEKIIINQEKNNSFSKMNGKNNNKSGKKIPLVKWMGKIIINLEKNFLQ